LLGDGTLTRVVILQCRRGWLLVAPTGPTKQALRGHERRSLSLIMLERTFGGSDLLAGCRAHVQGLDVEADFLPCQRMVEVHVDFVGGDVQYSQDQKLAVLVLHLESVAGPNRSRE